MAHKNFSFFFQEKTANDLPDNLNLLFKTGLAIYAAVVNRLRVLD